MQLAGADRIGAPHLAFLYVDIIVISEYVALVDKLSLAVDAHSVEVVLNIVVVNRVCSERIRVDIMERVTSQQVVHGLIMVAFVVAIVHAEVQDGVFAGLGCQCRGNVERQVVVVLGLHIIECVGTCCGSLLVGPVEAVPVNLAISF